MQGKEVRIDAARIYLRPLARADCTPVYVGWLQDPEVTRFLEIRHAPQTLETVQAFVDRINASDNEHLFGIFLKADDRHIGNIKIGPIGKIHPVADVTLLLGARECWGQGYGSEAIVAVSHYGIRTFDLSKLTASMYAANEASYRAFLKAGFNHEGLRRRHMLLEGRMCDVLEVGMTSEDLS